MKKYAPLKTLGVLVFAVGCIASMRVAAGAQSLTFTKGQNIAPAYEGWEQDADGAKFFVFGYMNRNWVEEIDLPPGPDNSILPGGPDVGQPTHFLPRRNRFVFKVPVPKTFTEKDEMIWTLTAHGATEKAWATLRPDYLLDDVVKASETGALGAGTSSPEVRSNKPPVVKIDGPKTLTAKVGAPVTLTAIVTDDGIPKPRNVSALAALFGASNGRGGAAGTGGEQGGAAAAPGGSGGPGATAGRGGLGDLAAAAAAAEAAGLSPAQVQQLLAARRNPSMVPPTRITVGKVTGLHLSWFVYRGAGAVMFTPEQVKSWEDTRAGANSPWAPSWTAPPIPADGKQPVQVSFSEPGTYILRCRADDGALVADDEITIVVTR